MANNTEMQIKMRDEIKEVIGDRMATNKDINVCHYVNAFIAEVLRFKGVSPLSFPHHARYDMQLGIEIIVKYTGQFSYFV